MPPKRLAENPDPARALAPEERYDANIEHILHSAAVVFAEKGFGLASIRDIAAQARISFPRIYYYLRNKEELLYLISKRTFEQLLSSAQDISERTEDPEDRLRLLIQGHIEHHTDNLPEVKVLVREAHSLSGRYAAHIGRVTRDYSRLFRKTAEQVAAKYGRTLEREESRIITSVVLGAMNWCYAWYEPSRDNEQRSRIVDEVYGMAKTALLPRRPTDNDTKSSRSTNS